MDYIRGHYKSKFTKKITEPILFDGLVGCYYAQCKNTPHVFSEYANISDSETIIQMHKEFIEAGANAIRTNTLHANPYTMQANQSTICGLIARGYKNAQAAVEASHQPVDIFASVGQFHGANADETMQAYQIIIDTFIKCGASSFVFENFSDTKHIAALSKYVKGKNKKSLVLIHFTCNPEGFTSAGISGLELTRQMQSIPGVDLFGFSCTTGPQHLSQYLSTLSAIKKVSFCMANAGKVDGTEQANCTPAYFGKTLSALTALGVQIIGGHNRTSPAHIRQLAKQLNESQVTKVLRETPLPYPETRVLSEARPSRPVCREEKDIVVELFQSTDYAEIHENSLKFLEAGASVLSFSDSSHGKRGIDSAFLSAKIKRETKCETMLRVIANRSNPQTLRSTVLGLHMEEIRNILTVSGEPNTKHAIASPSFSSIEMLEYLDQINKTTLLHDPIILSATFNPNVSDISSEIEKTKLKLSRGVKNLITPPVFCNWALENIKKAKEALSEARIFAGMMPITSMENAIFLRNEISDIAMPNEFIEAFRDLSFEKSVSLAIERSLDFATTLRHYCDGFFIVSSPGKTELICNLIRALKGK